MNNFKKFEGMPTFYVMKWKWQGKAISKDSISGEPEEDCWVH